MPPTNPLYDAITDYFVDCWNYFRVRYPALKESELILETIPAVTWCNACEKTYPTVQYGKTCPWCGSGETWLIQGNETNIREIAVPDDEEQADPSG